MYIVHVKITLHIQVFVYLKNVPTKLIMGLPRIYAHYCTQQKK